MTAPPVIAASTAQALPDGPAVALAGVSRVYAEGRVDEVVALRDVSLTVAAGQVALLRGPSGSGKSTLLALVAGHLRPTEGDVRVLGERVGRLPDALAARFRARHLGFVFQRDHLLEDRSALENVIVPLVPGGLTLRAAAEKARAALERFGIATRAAERVRNLSGGERQRVAIARAVVNDPALVLADEPTAHLDEALTRGFLEVLGELRAEGRTVVVATHDPLVLAWGGADRVLALDRGRLLDGG
jgi:putative ABC transport system ATP-binding protein